MHRGEGGRLGPYAAILVGCVATGIAIGLFVAGPTTQNRHDHYLLAGLVLGLGVGITALGVLRALTSPAVVRQLHPLVLGGMFTGILIAILTLFPPLVQVCGVNVGGVVSPGGDISPGSLPPVVDCSLRLSPGAFILLAGWGIALAATIVARRQWRSPLPERESRSREEEPTSLT